VIHITKDDTVEDNMKAAVTAHSKYTISDIDPRLYGSFIEPLGRAGSDLQIHARLGAED